MCGIAGIILGKNAYYQDLGLVIKKLTEPLIHRGPDAIGFWIDEKNRLALGHTRLAIIDPSPKANQPLESLHKRFVIAYNGEIYNYKELSRDLEKKNYNINYNSDTEVIVNYIEAFGIEVFLNKINGMFAIAIYDKTYNELYLIRDRIGVKPLYYAWANDESFLFASELKSIMLYDNFYKEINLHSLSLYFSHNYIPSPLTIFKDAYKLNPAEIMKINLNNYSYKVYKVKRYWSILSEYNQNSIYKEDAINLVHDVLKDSVKLRSISDVPLGVYLSGGIDSTLVTTILSTQKTSVKTFSLGFEEADFNEAIYAKKIAEYLNTSHHEIYIKAKDAENLIFEIPYYYDEPFSDSSQIPTLFLSKYAKNHVKVILSGDGGDELFAGYTRYPYALNLWKYLKQVPNSLKQFISKILLFVSNLPTTNLNLPCNTYLKKFSIKFILRRLAEILDYNDFSSFYIKLCSHFLIHGSIIKNYEVSLIERNINTSLSPLQKMTLIDILSYLPDDILTKVDRGSMAYSIEAREPYLDINLIRIAVNLPDELKIKNNTQKWILKEILKRYLPEDLFNRPKKGFSIPLSNWLKNPFKNLVEEILLYGITNDLKEILDTNVIHKYWTEHIENKVNHQYVLWSIIIFILWYNKWMKNSHKAKLL